MSAKGSQSDSQSLNRLPDGHPYRSRSKKEQERLLNQIWGIRKNAKQWMDSGFPNAAAKAYETADMLYDGTYWDRHKSYYEQHKSHD